MINLNDYEQRINRYGGSEEKRTYFKDGKFYLVKIPDRVREKNNSLSYMNNAFSEYISCNIFKSVGISVQETDLSILNNKIVCVCKDFTDEEHTLIEYCNANNETEKDLEEKNSKNKELDINNIMETIKNNEHIGNKEKLIHDFWKIFIIDSLICNKDRHNENWGFLENNKTGEITLAPVYDCGSSLFALYSEEKCNYCINNKREYKNLVCNCNSVMRENGTRINYYNYIMSLKNNNCNRALLEIYNKINLKSIFDIIDNTPYLTNIYKTFYKELIQSSYELILSPAYKKLLALEKENNLNEKMVWENKNSHFENGQIVPDQKTIINTESLENFNEEDDEEEDEI